MTPERPRRSGRVAGCLFLAAWLGYAFFHQGGGWNQNARFAQVRALVEEGRLDVDAHLLYAPRPAADGRVVLERSSVAAGHFERGGRTFVLAWPGGAPVAEPRPGAVSAPLERLAASGDLAFAGGRFYPNKAPGTTLLAVPGYALVYGAERLFGLDPDAWWTLTVNAWLTTLLSVGLVSALGAVLLWRVALRLWPGRRREALAAALAFAFATPFLPYATLLFEQNPATVALLAAFHLALAEPQRPRAAIGSGVAAGLAVLTSYVAALPVALLALYVWRRSAAAGAGRFLIGLVGPLLLLGGYHAVCFGHPLRTSYHFQNPLFRDPAALLGVLGPPRLERLVGVLVSPFRGLFVAAPVLVLGAAGLVAAFREPRLRAEAALLAAIPGALLLFNVCFNGWHGGWSVGPRYLAPALPFLALPLTLAFARRPRATLALAALSAAILLVHTAVDAQPPVGTSPIAARPGRAPLLRDPLTEYALPILATGRARPILEAQIAEATRRAEAVWQEQGLSAAELEARRAELTRRGERALSAGSDELPLSWFVGPVSAHPVGVYEPWVGSLFAPPAPQLGWNAFNAAELLLPQRRASLLVWLAGVGVLVAGALRACPASESAD